VKCHEAEDLLIRTENEKLSAADGRQLQDHLSRCSRCQWFRRGLDKVQELLERERTATPAPANVSSLWRSICSRMEKLARPPRPAPRWVRRALAGSAAIAAACALVALGLWLRSAGLQREIEGLRADNVQLSHQYEQLVSRSSRPEQRLASLGPTALTHSTRLYRELADFYRLPVLWVVEGDRGVEMKLGSEPAVAPMSEAEGDLLFLAVTIADNQDPNASTTVRIVTHPGQRISAELSELSVGQGHWRLECVPTAFGEDRLVVALKLEHIAGAAPAVLATEVTLTPGTVVEPGSVVVAGRTYTVQVFGQRAPSPRAGPATEHEGQTI